MSPLALQLMNNLDDLSKPDDDPFACSQVMSNCYSRSIGTIKKTLNNRCKAKILCLNPIIFLQYL